MAWEVFEREALRYDAWYATARGRRASDAEEALLGWLLGAFPDAHTALEIGCGTGHFTRRLARHGLEAIGLDRAPAMLAALRRLDPELPAVLADAHRLPLRDGAVDVAIFIATLEFLERPRDALAEAARVARMGIAALILNRWSRGGISRRWGRQSRGAILPHARDLSAPEARRLLRRATGPALRGLRWRCALFPGPFHGAMGRLPLGDMIGIAAELGPAPAAVRVRPR